MQSDTDSTDLSTSRPLIQRFEYVANHIIGMIPSSGKEDLRIQVFIQLVRDAIRDIALVPDEVIIPIAKEAAHAFMFIAEGDLDELRARENGNAAGTE